jgi:hypothetical protein
MTVAAGSNGQAVNALTGGVLNLGAAAPVGLPSAGRISITHGTGDAIVSYTGKAGSTLTGCTSTQSTVIATGDTVRSFHTPIWGTPDVLSRVQVHSSGIGMTDQIRGVGSTHFMTGRLRWSHGQQTSALTLRDDTQDVVNLNTTNKRLELNNGLNLRLYAGNYATSTFQVEGATGHILAAGAAVPAVAIGAGVGTAPNGATVSVAGSDSAGTITITAASTGVAAGILAALTFNTVRGSSARVILTPADVATAALGVPYYGTKTTAGFQVGVTGTPTAGGIYKYDYVVLES